MKVLDVSFSRISPAWAHGRMAEGWELLIQDVWTGGYANNDRLRAIAAANLRDWRGAGGRTAIYSNAAPWRAPQRWFEESLLNAGSEFEHCAGVVIDYEIADGQQLIADEAMVEFIGLWRTTGKPLGTYSGDWFVGMMRARGKGFADPSLPYWYARYDGIAAINPGEVAHPLGPVLAKQYGGGELDGVTVDFNVFDPGFFPEEDDMSLYDSKIVDGIKALADGQFVSDGYAIYQVDKKGDVPELVRVDDSKVGMVNTPVSPIPLGVAMYCFHGRQLT